MHGSAAGGMASGFLLAFFVFSIFVTLPGALLYWLCFSYGYGAYFAYSLLAAQFLSFCYISFDQQKNATIFTWAFFIGTLMLSPIYFIEFF